MLPIVALGIYYVYQKTKSNEIYATDPLVVTIDGVDASLEPMFDLTDMKPGDTYERCFKVKNALSETLSVEMSGFITLEEKNFSDILEIYIYDQMNNNVIFEGLMKDLFPLLPINLGNFSASSEKTYCIKVYFPHDAENEYQEAKIVFDIIWRNELPISDIPQECWELADQFESVIYGTEGDDYIKGNTKSNLIFALGGDDKVDSSSSSDCVILGEGNDYIRADSGNDIVLGGNGNDEIYTGTGNDTVYGDGGDDKIYTGSNNDLVYADDGNDYVNSGSGSDLVYGNNGDDYIDLGTGNDRAFGKAGNDKILGSSNNDHLDGGEGNDDIDGESGKDTCVNGVKYTSCEITFP